MSRLVGLYPRPWRVRYESEFLALLAARPPSLRDRLDIVLGAVDARIRPQLPGGAAPSEYTVARGAGLAAIAGGALWCATYLGPGLARAEGEWSGLIVLAVGLMLLSLPGAYLAAYRRPLLVASGVGVVSVLAILGGQLPYGLLLAGPGLALLALLGPGALALAAARAGVAPRRRWWLLAGAFAAPLGGAVLAGLGAFAAGNWVALAVAASLPYGLAWTLIGASLIRHGGRAYPGPRSQASVGAVV